MILIDKPYVSDFVKITIEEYNIPVVKTQAALDFGFDNRYNLIEERIAVEKVKTDPNELLLTVSENSIGWIAKNLSFTDLPEKIERFKNKAKFRELTRALNPGYFFKEVSFEKLSNISIEDVPVPFIIKPTTGFFSMGVHKVNGKEDWPETVVAIHNEIHDMQGIYPEEVFNTTSFILEACIEGEEYAVDAYFDSEGEPVILSIFKHLFSSLEDVGDRVYMTTKTIVEENSRPIHDYLQKIGQLTDVRDFPLHMEIRRTEKGTVMPIEINPMRFGGWCTTADVSRFAYGFNQYAFFFDRKKPDWDEILGKMSDDIYSIIVLDNSTGVDNKKIKSFDYDKVLSRFEHPLELRRVDFSKYPVFAFLFTKTRAINFRELNSILTSDLREFIEV